jgi:ABC-type lipoprotein release transport system permease subunit
MTSVIFAVVLAIFMQSLQKGTFDNLIRDVVGFHFGYIQVHAHGYWKEQIIENSFPADDRLIDLLRNTDGVMGVVPRIESYALGSSGGKTRGCMVTGTMPDQENAMTGLASRLIRGRYFRDSSNGVLVAEGLAGRLSLNVGDTLVLLGQGYQGSIAAAKFPVSGIVHFGSPQLNDAMVFLPLSVAQDFLGAYGRLTSLALDIESPGRLNEILKKVSEKVSQEYEVMSWKEMMPEIENHIRSDAASFYIWTGFLYLIIGFGIFSTLLMMTAERKFEFGVLVAIGMRKSKISIMLFAEMMCIMLMGTLTGMILAIPFVWYFRDHPLTIGGEGGKAFEQWGFEPILPTVMDPGIFMKQAAIVLSMACLVGLYPVFKVRGLNAVKNMKK